jgi:hypothetical protein
VRPTANAEIAGEHELARATVAVRPQFDDCRAEDVAGITEVEADRRLRLANDTAGDRRQQAQRCLRIGHRVQRRRIMQGAARSGMRVREDHEVQRRDIERQRSGILGCFSSQRRMQQVPEQPVRHHGVSARVT